MRALRQLASGPSAALVVTSPEAVLERVPGVGALRSFTIAAGRDLDLEALRRFCEEAGYAIDERVDEPGEVAIRGAVIDIFPGGRDHPVRLELDGAEVTGIRSYDAVTQRTAEPQPEIVLDAIRLAGVADRSGTLLDHLPDATIVESPGAPAARRRFLALVAEAARERQEEPDTPACLGDWAGEIDQIVVSGGGGFREVAFLHRPSRTAVLTDLIDNLEASRLPLTTRVFAGLAGALAPDGKAPIYLRLVVKLRRREAAAAALRVIAWEPERVIFAHGRWFDRDGAASLRRSLDWLVEPRRAEQRL